jgi:hypothetical protein
MGKLILITVAAASDGDGIDSSCKRRANCLKPKEIARHRRVLACGAGGII